MHVPWQLDYQPSPHLPPLAWLAQVRQPRVRVMCGTSVTRRTDAFFEGTWIGPPDLASIVDSTTPFGTGMAVRDGTLYVVPPGHTMAMVYSLRRDDELLVSNTLVGLLEGARLALLPDVDYSSLLFEVAEGLERTPIALPTSGGTVQCHYYENLRVTEGGRLEIEPKRRERPFSSYADYVARLDAALGSALANAAAYPPVVALSSGYDSPAVAVLAARHGCRTALTFEEARPPVTTRDASDSGAAIGRQLGMTVQTFDRSAYMSRSDFPEAEFLATGYTGEEVPLVAMEDAVRRRTLLSGGLGGAMWLRGREPRSDLHRKDFSACSMTEFRLRADFVDLPISIMGFSELPSLAAISMSEEMRPWSVGGVYDKPIPRRIVEEAGIPRGSFGKAKRAVTALLHQRGAEAMAPTTVAAVRQFAAAEGRAIDLSPRRRPSRYERAVVKAARALHAERLVAPLVRHQRTITAHRPDAGSLLFRWAVAQVRDRYATLRKAA